MAREKRGNRWSTEPFKNYLGTFRNQQVGGSTPLAGSIPSSLDREPQNCGDLIDSPVIFFLVRACMVGTRPVGRAIRCAAARLVFPCVMTTMLKAVAAQGHPPGERMPKLRKSVCSGSARSPLGERFEGRTVAFDELGDLVGEFFGHFALARDPLNKSGPPSRGCRLRFLDAPSGHGRAIIPNNGQEDNWGGSAGVQAFAVF